MNARPYAVQMQRVLGSVAARVDAAIHPLLTMRDLRPESKTLVIIVTGDNSGPPSAEGVINIFAEVTKKLPGVKVRRGKVRDVFASANKVAVDVHAPEAMRSEDGAQFITQAESQ